MPAPRVYGVAMLLLFAHGLTAAKGGARDCVGVWPDTAAGMRAAQRRAEQPGADGPPAGYEWCSIFRATPDGSRLSLVATRAQGGVWLDRFKEPLDVQPYDG
jgi:hypothetical protein